MNPQSEPSLDKAGNLLNVISRLFGLLVLAIGLVNTFWGNDPFFGIFLVVLAFVYFPRAEAVFRRITGFAIHSYLKIALGIFIIWAALGVGELFDKIALMQQSF